MKNFKKVTEYDYATGFTTTTYTAETSHAANCTLIDLDYPMYGTIIVKCNDQKYDLEVVKAALKLVSTLKGVV